MVGSVARVEALRGLPKNQTTIDAFANTISEVNPAVDADIRRRYARLAA